jgi:hypothetical protein
VTDLGLTVTWGQQDWSTTLIEALTAEAAVLQAPNINRVEVRGRTGRYWPTGRTLRASITSADPR